ncbi:MAG: hypothetical protein L6Q71_03685 [Planctomycetes bacterium]|nr:hypothetical protein [Planctomycetota bacterium]
MSNFGKAVASPVFVVLILCSCIRNAPQYPVVPNGARVSYGEDFTLSSDQASSINKVLLSATWNKINDVGREGGTDGLPLILWDDQNGHQQELFIVKENTEWTAIYWTSNRGLIVTRSSNVTQQVYDLLEKFAEKR